MATLTSALTSSSLAAAQDPTQPQHHFGLGQILATVLLGSVEAIQAFADPAYLGTSITSFVDGFLNIWLPAAAAAQTPVTQPPAAVSVPPSAVASAA